MKNCTIYLFMVCLGAASLQSHISKPACEVSIKPEWRNLDDQEKSEKFGGKWMLAGKITIRKRIKDTITLQALDLKWEGKEIINNLNASLYRQTPNQELIPIEETLVCDGHWNKDKQLLQLKFDHKEYLHTQSIFCLVLTVSNQLEPILKKGSFKVITQNLPYQLKPAVIKNDLRISFLTASNKSSRKARRLNNTRLG
jgi:hypothetical protein